ncbi:MAG: PAS domain-containing protein [Verrucomicrobia bacterium]|nr:PAS domain-containing protein [Verrucomicrobiota bacterium]
MNFGITPKKGAVTDEMPSRSAPIIERAPLPIIEVNGPDHLISYVNSAFCNLVGKTRDQLMGKGFSEIVCGGDQCVPILNKVYETGAAVTHVQPDDSETDPAYWLYAMWPALDENERPAGVIIQLAKATRFRQNVTAMNEALLIAGLRQHELTDEAEQLNVKLQAAQAEISHHAANLERDVNQRTAELRESIRSLESLTYTMAHDLRAPIRAMSGLTEALLEDVPLNATGKQYAAGIHKAAMRMDELINDLLDYGQLTHISFPTHVVDLRIEIGEVLAGIAETIKTTHAEIRIREPLPLVFGNKTLLCQVFSNLILNAIKFVAPGTVPKVLIYAETRDATVRFWVEDNGIGIAPEHHNRIFGVFQRLHTTSAFPGTGVGLAIIKTAMDRMSGDVGLESAHSGSRFWIELPKVI